MNMNAVIEVVCEGNDEYDKPCTVDGIAQPLGDRGKWVAGYARAAMDGARYFFNTPFGADLRGVGIRT